MNWAPITFFQLVVLVFPYSIKETPQKPPSFIVSKVGIQQQHHITYLVSNLNDTPN